MKILALDFSSPQRSVAVLESKAGVSAAAGFACETGVESSKPLALVEAALSQARLEREQIECITVGLGPGSYAGIRSAISLAQGWQLAQKIRLLGVSSVECLAAQAQAEGFSGSVNVIIDAQRNEFYMAAYEIKGEAPRLIEPLRLASMAEVAAKADAGEVLIGPEVTHWFSSARTLFPDARVLAKLAARRTDFLPGETLEPIYLRQTSFVKAAPPRTIV